MCNRARKIVKNVDLPVLVDGTAGFVNAPHTCWAVKQYAKDGIAGIHIETHLSPTPVAANLGLATSPLPYVYMVVVRILSYVRAW